MDLLPGQYKGVHSYEHLRAHNSINICHEQAVGALLLGGSKAKARLGMIAGVVMLRTLLQDRIARLNGRSVEHVLRQDRPAFMRLIGLSVLQAHFLLHTI